MGEGSGVGVKVDEQPLAQSEVMTVVFGLEVRTFDSNCVDSVSKALFFR